MNHKQPEPPCNLVRLTGSAGGGRRARETLQQYLERLERLLPRATEAGDRDSVRQILLEMSDIIRSGTAMMSGPQYGCILNRLANLYAEGLGQQAQGIWATTAAAYAGVVEAISRQFSGHDYSRPIGQLLYYMGQLYDTRKSSWHTVYRHILSMPDDIEGVQLLKKACFGEIELWASEGVANLFDICHDLEQQLARMQNKIDRLQHELDALRQQQPAADSANVFSLERKRGELEIRQLAQRLQRLRERRDGRQNTIRLIESNIREFESKLKESRRAYFIQAVG